MAAAAATAADRSRMRIRNHLRLMRAAYEEEDLERRGRRERSLAQGDLCPFCDLAVHNDLTRRAAHLAMLHTDPVDFLSSPPTRQCPRCVAWRRDNFFLLRPLQGDLRPDQHQPTAPAAPRAMDPALWSALPPDALHRVLAAVPAASKVRFSVVCRAWQALLASSDFKLLTAAAATAAAPAPAVCVMDTAPMFHGSLSSVSLVHAGQGARAYRLGAGFLPPHLLEQLDLAEVQAQEGLVSLATYRNAEEKPGPLLVLRLAVCVANPVTRAWAELPPELCVPRQWATRLLVHSPGHYSVLLLTFACSRWRGGYPWRPGSRLVAKLYDSRARAWRDTLLQGLPPHRRDPAADQPAVLDPWPQFVLCRGRLYLAAPWGLIVYSMETGEMLAKRMVQDADEEEHGPGGAGADEKMLQPYRLLGGDAGVFCVPEKLVAGVLGVWQLRLDTLAWHNVSVMPQDLVDAVVRAVAAKPASSSSPAAASADGDGASRPKLVVRNVGLVRGRCFFLTLADTALESCSLVAYDMEEQSWKVCVRRWAMCPSSRSDTYHFFTPSFEHDVGGA